MKPKLLIFASGTSEGGGSGFEKLVETSRIKRRSVGPILSADIVGVVSNYENGGVRKRADRLGIPFQYFPKPWSAENYQRLAVESGADFFALSGWLKLVTGLDPESKFNSRTVINIHPGPLPEFGGNGLYGHHVHEAVIGAYREGKITCSAVCMHFVTEAYDRGPVFFRYRVKIRKDDTPETLAKRVNQYEHQFQPVITNMVLRGYIGWDGVHHDSLYYPPNYQIDDYER